MSDIPKLWYQSKAPLLLTGESGTGKSYFARLVHRRSSQSEKKFLTVPLASLNETLMESELFGHRRGSFTGAQTDHKGLCEVVGDGILFLDEVGELSKDAQKKLLYLLEERKFLPIGECDERNFQGRIIAATNCDLEMMVKAGSFRADLYYRLNVFRHNLAPLREQQQLLREFIVFFQRQFQDLYNINPLKITPEAMDSLLHHNWPGNLRELKNCIEYLSLSERELIEENDLPWNKNHQMTLLERSNLNVEHLPARYHEALEIFEREYLASALRKRRGRVNKTSREVGLSKSTLIAKMKKYGINVPPLKDALSSGAVLPLTA